MSFTLGSFVNDVTIQPFIRGQAVNFSASGMRPNTIVYAFFDKVAVSRFCIPTDSNFVATGNLGGTLRTDSSGNVYGIFHIPAGTFRIGDRVFELMDIANRDVEFDSITTQSSAIFSASNLNITVQQINAVTRPPPVTEVVPSPVIETPINPRPTTCRAGWIPAQDFDQWVANNPERAERNLARGIAEGWTLGEQRNGCALIDPLAQTIFIDEPTGSLPGVFITKVDLFFFSKPVNPNTGVTVTLNYCENGVPTPKIVPFGEKRLLPANVNTSTNGSAVTQFVFDSPVFLLSQKEYALIVWPDGGDPGYEIWIGELGQTDRVTNRIIDVNSSIGTLYTSSTGRQWTAYQKEDMKFTLHRAVFTAGSGNVIFTNSNTEYLKLSQPPTLISNPMPGSVIPGEKVFVSNGIVTVTSNCVTSISNTVISTFPANATLLFATNKMIYLRSNNSAQTDIRTITSVPNTSAIVINQAPTFNDGNASIGYLYSNGGLYGYARSMGGADVTVEYSSANSTVNFTSLLANSGLQGNALLIGSLSGHSANLDSTQAIAFNEATAQFAYTTVTGTEATVGIKSNIYTNNVQTSNTMESSFNTVVVDDTYPFVDFTRSVLSRSDELYYSGGSKSLQVKAALVSGNPYITPVFDDIKSSVLALKNIVTVSNSELLVSESQPIGGPMINKYISRTVLLDQEAEDLVVYLTAHRALESDIFVFCKLLNGADPNPLSTKNWTLMNEVTPKPYSSKADFNDLRELKYVMPTGNNSTTTTTAFRNTDNLNIVRYYLDNGSFFDGYGTFAIKIVLAVTSNQTAIVPRVSDMRAIALQV